MGQVMLAYDKTNAKRRVAIKVVDKGSLKCEESDKYVVVCETPISSLKPLNKYHFRACPNWSAEK
jgi:hypothetical protein